MRGTLGTTKKGHKAFDILDDAFRNMKAGRYSLSSAKFDFILRNSDELKSDEKFYANIGKFITGIMSSGKSDKNIYRYYTRAKQIADNYQSSKDYPDMKEILETIESSSEALYTARIKHALQLLDRPNQFRLGMAARSAKMAIKIDDTRGDAFAVYSYAYILLTDLCLDNGSIPKAYDKYRIAVNKYRIAVNSYNAAAARPISSQDIVELHNANYADLKSLEKEFRRPKDCETPSDNTNPHCGSASSFSDSDETDDKKTSFAQTILTKRDNSREISK